MKNKKYRIVFIVYLVWLITSFFVEKKWTDIIFTSASILFLVLIIYDLIKNNLIFAFPSILNLIIDVIGLSTILSGTIVQIDYTNYFVYIFIFCCLVFIFTEQRTAT